MTHFICVLCPNREGKCDITINRWEEKIMAKKEFEGHFTNHFRWRSSATWLYQSSVPKQIIVETTVQRSFDGVREYRYTYFKKRCRRERGMAIVEQKLHDRKELWFHIWYAKTMSSSRGAKLGSLSNHDDDGNKNPQNLHI